MTRASLLGSLSIILLLAKPAAAQDNAAVTDALRVRLEALRQDGGLPVRGVALQTGSVLPDFYARREYRPAWAAPGRVDALVEAVRASRDDGLEPRDYLLEPLLALARDASAPGAPATLRADLDLLATEALIRLWSSLRFGKVDPALLDTTWHYPSTTRPLISSATLDSLLASEPLARAVAALAPGHPLYRQLREELRRYRALDTAGGWPTIGPGPDLAVGMTDARVPSLRRQLAATGDLSPEDAQRPGERYDSSLAAGVARFQARLGLAADGVLGPRTRAELNVAPAARIQTLRVNLERGRWVLPGLGRTFVAVNINAFLAYFVRDDTLRWSGRAIVGQPFQQTPEFRARMTYLVLNPRWTIPPDILTDEVLPAIRRDPGYLARNGMEVVSREGKVVDPAEVDWSRYDGRTLPYRIVQAPGADNPLGRVKFVFPNAYAVYLHDTPARHLFQRPRRAFSHGCIRIERPMALAQLLVGDSTWTAAALDSVVALGVEQAIPLPHPVPVLMLYWTAWTAADGALNFRPDVYGRDSAIIRALDAPFTLHGVP